MADMKTCEVCGGPFVNEDGYDYLHTCLVCWKESKSYTLTKSDKAFSRLQEHVQEVLEEHKKKLGDVQKELEKAKKRADTATAKAKAQIASPTSERISAVHLKALIFLSHPDKHKNSELATATTKWLLNLRSALK